RGSRKVPMHSTYFSHWKTTEVAVLAVVAGLGAWALSSRSVAQSPAGQIRTHMIIDRAPTWAHAPDPYETFSGAVAVDTVRNEIILQSPRKLLVYDRLDNTPPKAALTGTKAHHRRTQHPNVGQLWSLCGLEERRDLHHVQRHFRLDDSLCPRSQGGCSSAT